MTKAFILPRHLLGVELGRLCAGLLDRRQRVVAPAPEPFSDNIASSLGALALNSWQQADALARAAEGLATNLHIMTGSLTNRADSGGIRSEAGLEAYDPVWDLTEIAGHLVQVSLAIRDTADTSCQAARKVHLAAATDVRRQGGAEALVLSIKMTAHISNTCIHAIRDLNLSVHLLESICRSLSSERQARETEHVANTAFILGRYLPAISKSIQMTMELCDRADQVWAMTATVMRNLADLAGLIGGPDTSALPPLSRRAGSARIPGHNR